MHQYKFVIVGGGMAADSAVHGIREVDSSSEIAILSAEQYPPYDRPPLSKSLWTGQPLESIWRSTGSAQVVLHLETNAVTIDVANKRVSDQAGNTYGYEKLLLATGGRPRQLPFGNEAVIYLRTVDDYRRLRGLAAQGDEFIVLGGGFIGAEIAAALATFGRHVTMIFPNHGIGARLLPQGLSEFLTNYYRDRGVTVLTGQTPLAIDKTVGKTTVALQDGRKISADAIVAGMGIQPNVELAASAGLDVDNGVRVDDWLRTSDEDIYAAGDVANFYSPVLNRWLRIEHEDNANVMGLTAGRNMAGSNESYRYLPFFYSDLFDFGYEAVGEIDSRLEVIEDWQQGFDRGVLYYMNHKRVRGVLLWNISGQVAIATQLVSSRSNQATDSLIGRIR